MNSHNPNDVANSYCGHCHVFVEDLRKPRIQRVDAKPRTMGKGGTNHSACVQWAKYQEALRLADAMDVWRATKESRT